MLLVSDGADLTQNTQWIGRRVKIMFAAFYNVYCMQMELISIDLGWKYLCLLLIIYCSFSLSNLGRTSTPALSTYTITAKI